MNTQQIIFFDGFCNLCSSAVQFTIQRDKKNNFLFASLQSDFAAKTLAPFNLEQKSGGSIVLLADGKVYQRSTAALKVAKQLSGLWPLLYGFIIVPRFIRDAVYNYIAKNRYKWYGKQDSCWLPKPALKNKFID